MGNRDKAVADHPKKKSCSKAWCISPLKCSDEREREREEKCLERGS